MAGSGDILKLALIGGAGYLAYEWWQNQQAAARASSTGTGTGAASGTTPAAASGGSAPAPAPASGGNSGYSGPSLDAIYAQLVAAAIAGMQGGDTSVTCGSNGALSGFGIVRNIGGGTGVVQRKSAGSTGAATSGSTSTGNASCSTPLANPDVWNWYLMNRTAMGQYISAAPGPDVAFPGADRTVPITGAQYWAGVAPLLQQQLPGLSGLGAFGYAFRRSGMGLYVGRRRGMGDTSTPDAITSADIAAAAGTYAPDASAALATPVGNIDPNSLPLSLQVAAATGGGAVPSDLYWLAGGALLLLFGVGMAARR